MCFGYNSIIFCAIAWLFFGCKNELFKETDNATYNLNPTRLEVLLVPMESDLACDVDLVHYRDSHHTYGWCVELKLFFVHTIPYVSLVVDKSEVCSKIWVRKSHHHGHHSLWPTNSQIFWPNSFYLLRKPKKKKQNCIVNGEKLIRGIYALCELVPAPFFGLQTGDQCYCLRVFKSRLDFG